MLRRIPFFCQSLVSGIVLGLAFLPFHESGFFAFIGIVLYLRLLSLSTPKQAIFQSAWYGMGFFASTVYWVFISIHVFGGTPILLTLIFLWGFILLLSTPFMLLGFLWRRFFPRECAFKYLVIFPCFWVMTEVLRTFILTGFPWVLLGYSQLHSPLIGFAPFVSVYGISWIVAFMSGLLFYGLKRYPSYNTFWALIILLCVSCTGIALKMLSFGRIVGLPISVSMVQGNIPQSVKWQPGFLKDAAQIYVGLSLPHVDSNILVWPEAAIPGLLSSVDFSTLQKALAKNHSTLVTGAIDLDTAGNYYNAMQVLGEGNGRYHKKHLVPFGEYLPFENTLRGLIAFFNLPMSNLMAGPENQPLLIAHHYPFGGFICYEIAYLPIVLQALPDSNFLVSISDDSWFGHSLAAYQQEVMAQFRSIETARYQITVGNDGITAVIDNKGHITSQLPRFERGVLTDVIYPMQGETPLVFIGWKALLAFLGLLTFWGIFRYWHLGKRASHGS